jgi:ABC-type multidrug transport system permease subunit
MKRFNINSYMYVQITEQGWKHLEDTVGDDYIKNCITSGNYKVWINGEYWYRLQCHAVFELMPVRFGSKPLFKSNVLFDDDALELFVKV